MLWCVNSAAWCSQVFVCCDCFVCQFSYVRLKIKYRRTEYLDFRREYNIYIYIYGSKTGLYSCSNTADHVRHHSTFAAKTKAGEEKNHNLFFFAFFLFRYRNRQPNVFFFLCSVSFLYFSYFVPLSSPFFLLVDSVIFISHAILMTIEIRRKGRRRN